MASRDRHHTASQEDRGIAGALCREMLVPRVDEGVGCIHEVSLISQRSAVH